MKDETILYLQSIDQKLSEIIKLLQNNYSENQEKETEIKIEKVMLDVVDVMKIMGIGRDNAYNLFYSKEFPVKRMGRRMLVHKDIFNAWLKGEYQKNKRAIKKDKWY